MTYDINNHLLMDASSIAPCGVLCDLCLGFQRAGNKCMGCNDVGNKPYHCTVCSIKGCSEKNGDDKLLCIECVEFPCRRIKNLDKRYRVKYGESPIRNLQSIREVGIDTFIKNETEKWKCKHCGQLLCVHRELCLQCGTENEWYPKAD